MFRYMAVAWNAADSSTAAIGELVARRIHSSLPDMRCVFETQGLRVFAAGMRSGAMGSYPLLNGQGVVLGKLFRQSDAEHGVPQPIVLSDFDSTAIESSRGSHLVEQYWGRYVAFGRDRSNATAWALRDPCSGLPCFVTTFDSATIFFSWMEDCCALDLQQFAIDWKYASALATDFPLQGAVTGLDGVSEVRMGECLILGADGRQSRAQYWNPVEISRRDAIRDFDEAVVRARSVVDNCISAWASCYPRILFMLSGGLDSSIVLSSLVRARTQPEIRCVNYYDASIAGDERRYARLAASRARRELSEVQFDPTAVPAETILTFARLPCPTPWGEAFYTPLRDSELARQWSFPAVFDGNFGDSLFFYYSDSSLRVADYMYDRGLWSGELMRAAIASAARERCWLGSVLIRGVRRGLLHPRCRPADHLGTHRWFVKREVMEAAKGYADFIPPYLAGRPRIAPGKMEHILGFGTAPAFYGPLSRVGDSDRVQVLSSQPMRELFLRIPTYILTARLGPRAVARQAFREELPPEVFTRHLKGTVNDFLARFLEHNHHFVREMLLDGLLVKHGILDRPRVEDFFMERKYSNVPRATEIVLYHLSLEAWAQGWVDSSRLRAAA